ncbi:MAG TPA: DNA cytosine methyltransferase, partial [Actinomycetota bacterium]
FRRWRRQLERLGYTVDHRVLDASLYGAPTRRRRLFLVARCDGQPIVWPEPTHGPGRLPLHTAAECIDWSLPCPSIFERRRPLAEKTLWRIAQGIRRFVLETPDPFIVQVNHGKREARASRITDPLSTVTAERRGHAVVAPTIARYNGGQRGHRRGQSPAEPFSTLDCANRFGLVAPTLIQTGYGERPGQAARVPGLHKPLGTCVDGQKHALVSAFIHRYFGGPRPVVGADCATPLPTTTAQWDHHSLAAVALAKFRGTREDQPGSGSVREPLPTITAGGIHVAEVRAFLTAYYSRDSGQELDEPLRTVTAKHRLGIVIVSGIDYQITDIGLRMLEPPELLRAQFGRFAEQYDLSRAPTKAAKVRLIGNSVAPEVAEALVRANVAPASARRVA